MKKIDLIFLFCGVFSLVSCSSEEPILQKDKTVNNFNFNKRSPQEALSLAESLCGKALSRSGNNSDYFIKKVDRESLSVIENMSSRSGTDTLIYAINFTDNQGYVLVSANKETVPILAIIDKGNFQKDTDENESYENFLNNAKNYVSSVSGIEIPDPNPPTPLDPIMIFKTDTIKKFSCTEPLVKVNWGQCWPENMYCENKKAGCAPVAVAQALTYFRSIDKMDITFESRDCDEIHLDWGEISQHKKSLDLAYPLNSMIQRHYDVCDAPEETHTTIGSLVRQLGEIMKSEYMPFPDEETRTKARDIELAAKVVFPNLKHYEVAWAGTAFMGLGGETIGIASAVRASDKNGHTFILDGKAYIFREIITYYDYNPKDGSYSSKTHDNLQDDKYLHVNWGYNGSKDGFFLVDLLNDDKGVNTVTPGTIAPSGDPNYGYNSNLIIYMISK